MHSLVEGELPVHEGAPESKDSPNWPETSVILCSPSVEVLMRPVTEGRICSKFTIAEFIVARFRDVKGDWPTSCNNPLTLPVTERGVLGVSATAPVVKFASVQVHVGGVNTSVSWHGRWSIFTFLIRSRLAEHYYFLLREICDVIHSDSLSCFRWLH